MMHGVHIKILTVFVVLVIHTNRFIYESPRLPVVGSDVCGHRL